MKLSQQKRDPLEAGLTEGNASDRRNWWEEEAYNGVLDFLANHEQELDKLGVCSRLLGAQDDICVPAVVSTAQVRLNGICHPVVCQL